MCIVQRYSVWRCGCAIDDKDQTLVRICIAKARNAKEKCTLYVVPAFGDNLPLPDGFPNPQERYESSSSSSSGDSDEACCGDDPGGDEEMADLEDQQDGGLRASEVEVDSVTRDDDNSIDGEVDGLEDLGFMAPEPLWIINAEPTNKPSEEALTSTEPSQDPTTPIPIDPRLINDDTGEITRITKEDTIVAGEDIENWCDKELMDKIRAKDGKLPQPKPVSSPRMCPEHEAQFEHFSNCYWRSEMVWLRPKMHRHGYRACKDLLFAQRCADRLYELYLVWKFFNGGDKYGGMLATHPEFVPLHRPSRADDGYCTDDVAVDIPKSTQEVDSSETMQAVAREAGVNYDILKWALDDLLTPLRNKLHPREMLN